MIENKNYRAEVMQEFVLHPGWQILEESLKSRLRRAYDALAVEEPSNYAKIAFLQAEVRVCREVVGEPRRIIQEGKNGKEIQ